MSRDSRFDRDLNLYVARDLKAKLLAYLGSGASMENPTDQVSYAAGKTWLDAAKIDLPLRFDFELARRGKEVSLWWVEHGADRAVLEAFEASGIVVSGLVLGDLPILGGAFRRKIAR